MHRTKDSAEARAAARLAVGRFARHPSEEHANQVETALRRVRKLASAEVRRWSLRSRAGPLDKGR